MYGNASGPTIVYEYGARWAPECAETRRRIDEQLRLAHRYRNKLVEIELRRRERIREARERHGTPDMAMAAARVTGLTEELDRLQSHARQCRQGARSKRLPSDLRESIDAARAALREARQDLKEAKKAAAENEALQEEWARIDEQARQETREARAESGLYWGTYLSVEQGMQAARRSSRDPRFRRWNGEGKLAVQLQGGLSVDDVHGDDTRLQIDPVPPEVWRHPTPGRHPGAKVYARLRIGSDGRDPIWAAVPITMHRPLPEGGRIKWAYLMRRKVAQRYVYSVQLVVELPAPRPEASGEGVLALDVGWRMMGGDLRVAYWCDEEGNHGDLRLPADWLANMAWVDEQRAGRDGAFNQARATLLDWLSQAEAPEWLREELATLPQWRSPRRLVPVVERWGQERFTGDADIYERMYAWLCQEERRYKREGHGRDKYLRRRREIYRVFARRTAEQYGTVVVEDMDMRKLAREDVTDETRDTVRSQRYLASVSELRQALENAGLEVVKVPAEYTTQTCSVCGAGPDPEWDAERELEYRCAEGHRMDQDRNAARNLLAAATVASG